GASVQRVTTMATELPLARRAAFGAEHQTSPPVATDASKVCLWAHLLALSAANGQKFRALGHWVEGLDPEFFEAAAEWVVLPLLPISLGRLGGTLSSELDDNPIGGDFDHLHGLAGIDSRAAGN